jgi:hypothetical protein
MLRRVPRCSRTVKGNVKINFLKVMECPRGVIPGSSLPCSFYISNSLIISERTFTHIINFVGVLATDLQFIVLECNAASYCWRDAIRYCSVRSSSYRHFRFSYKAPSLSDCNQNWNMATNFNKSSQYKILRKSILWGSNCAKLVGMWTDGQTWRS